MEPVLLPDEMRAADEATIAAGTPAADLMDRAAYACATVALRRLGGGSRRRIVVVCGAGNNGGDGIAAARHLASAGATVTAFLLARPRGDADTHLELARLVGPRSLRIVDWSKTEALDAMGAADLAIDAVLGTGSTGEPRGPAAEAIGVLESSSAAVLAVDLPSGVSVSDGSVPSVAVTADVTVAIQALKIGHVVLPGATYCGDVEVADIGIAVDASVRNVPDAADVVRVLPRRAADAHKYSVGALAIVGGSTGMTGAAVLSAAGAQRAGAGLVALGVPQTVGAVIGSAVTEAITVPLADDEGQLTAKGVDEFADRLHRSRALAAGPGLGRGPHAVAVVGALLASDLPLVLDADGLWALAAMLRDDPDVLKRRTAPTVLTPHGGEFSSLGGGRGPGVDPILRAAQRWGATVHLKGPRAITAATDGRCWINPTGNPAAATAGSGDVLTGVIGALLAQGVDAADATWAGAYLHGLAADLAAGSSGARGVTALDITGRLSAAIRTVGAPRAPAGTIRHALDAVGAR